MGKTIVFAERSKDASLLAHTERRRHTSEGTFGIQFKQLKVADQTEALYRGVSPSVVGAAEEWRLHFLRRAARSVQPNHTEYART